MATNSGAALSPTNEGKPEGNDDNIFITRLNLKFVPHVQMLVSALEEMLGKKQFKIEMRHDVFTIKSRREISLPDLRAAIDKQQYPSE